MAKVAQPPQQHSVDALGEVLQLTLALWAKTDSTCLCFGGPFSCGAFAAPLTLVKYRATPAETVTNNGIRPTKHTFGNSSWQHSVFSHNSVNKDQRHYELVNRLS
jgi:hypothetical protein